jgi:adenylosuccinate lyase
MPNRSSSSVDTRFQQDPTLFALSPIDGRYHDKTTPLSDYLSEFALMRYRVKVESAYFAALCRWPLPELESFPAGKLPVLEGLGDAFTPENAREIKTLERSTNHDVKAVEYFLKRRLVEMGLPEYQEFVHFGLTSQDVNHTALPMMLRDAWREVLLPAYQRALARLREMARQWADCPMPARTHGQPASPTSVGKELYVFVERMQAQLDAVAAVPATGKFGGATGNFNAHLFAYPEIDWPRFADDFLASYLGLKRQQHTTQIEHYDHLAALLHGLSRANTIGIDLCRDLWSYISMDYFGQATQAEEVGSSAMPHKVNPIDFENAEGNFGMANAAAGYLAGRLPLSRLQRDLTDSTLSRNLSLPFAHSLIALQSLDKGLGKLRLRREVLASELDQQWAVVAEGIQTLLRRVGYPRAYEALKELTRTGSAIDRDTLQRFIESLEVEPWVKDRLMTLSPRRYTGLDWSQRLPPADD